MGLVLNMIQVNRTCEFFMDYLAYIKDYSSEDEVRKADRQLEMVHNFQAEYLNQVEHQIDRIMAEIAAELAKGDSADPEKIQFLKQYFEHLKYDVKGDWK